MGEILSSLCSECPCPVWSFRAFSTSTVILECSDMRRTLQKFETENANPLSFQKIRDFQHKPTDSHLSKCVQVRICKLALDSVHTYKFFFCSTTKNLNLSTHQDLKTIQSQGLHFLFLSVASFCAKHCTRPTKLTSDT